MSDAPFDYDSRLSEYEAEKARYDRAVYEDARKDWEFYVQKNEKTCEYFDKNIITVATASFGVSFAFIDKIVNVAAASYKLLLIVAWAFFAASIMISLFSFLKGARIFRKLAEKVIQDADARYQGKEVPEIKDKYNIIPMLSIFSFISFLGGMACLVSFIALNF
jgi:hypothetical protein